MLRCCVRNGVLPAIICGIPSSLPATTIISGGGDGTILSDLFSMLSLCTSNNRDPQTEATKCKLNNPSSSIEQSCLLLSMIAQCLKSTGRNSASFMLTTSQKKQHARLSILAHHFSSDENNKSQFLPHCAAAMLALASILSLEGSVSVESSVPEIAVPMIPRTSTLFDILKNSSFTRIQVGCTNQSAALSYWHGFRDGCVGLLESRLKWGGPLAVQQFIASGLPLLLVALLSQNHIDSQYQGSETVNGGLSPIGVVWMISSICQCLSGGALTFRQTLVKIEHAKLFSSLISDVHLRLLRSWVGPGGGKDGVRDIVNVIIDLFAFPFVAVHSSPVLPSANASVNSGFILNIGSPGGRIGTEDKDMVKAIEEDMDKYTKILLEVKS